MVFYRKLSTKLLIVLIVILLLTFVGVYIQYLNSEKLITREITSFLEVTAQYRSQHVITYLNMAKGRMVDFSSDGMIKNCLYDIKHYTPNGCTSEQLTAHLIKNKLPAVELLEEVSTIDTKGIIVASSNKALIGQDKKTEPYFTNGLKIPSIAYTKLGDTEDYALAVSAPVKRDNEAVGVIVGTLRLDGLQDILGDTFGLRNTGEVFLVGSDYLLRSNTRFIAKGILKEKIITENTLSCFLYKTDLHKKTIIFEDYRGVSVIGTHEYLPEYDMCVIAKIDEEEALQPNRRSLMTVAIIFLALSVLSWLFAGYFAQRNVINPVSKMLSALSELRRGKFKKISITTGDELEDIGKSFNDIIGSLQNLDVQREQVDRMKTNFLSITSHELRSPMTSIVANLQMLLQGYFGKLNERQKESLDVISRNTKNMDTLLLDLLEISRIESAKLKFNFVKTNMATRVSQLIESMRKLASRKRITILPKIEKLPEIEVDPERVMQVLRNLLDNAIKFSRPNSKIIVSVGLKGGSILFSVQDFGIGISKQNQSKIFEPFFQEEQTIYKGYKGIGLGLAICKGIVEAQNGKIWAESTKDRGTKFYFTVPLKPVKEIKPIKLLFSSRKPLVTPEASRIEQLAKLTKKEIDYEKVAQFLITKVSKLYGSTAIKKANDVPGLQVGINGMITNIKGDKKQVLNQLIEKYKDLMGDATNLIMESEITLLLK